MSRERRALGCGHLRGCSPLIACCSQAESNADSQCLHSNFCTVHGFIQLEQAAPQLSTGHGRFTSSVPVLIPMTDSVSVAPTMNLRHLSDSPSCKELRGISASKPFPLSGLRRFGRVSLPTPHCPREICSAVLPAETRALRKVFLADQRFRADSCPRAGAPASASPGSRVSNCL